MTFALALVASALIHLAALMNPAWELPDLDSADTAPPLDAVIAPPPAPRPRVAAAYASPHPRHAPRPRAATPAAAPEPPPATVAAATEPNPATEEAAVLPAPTFEPLAPAAPAAAAPAAAAVPIALPNKGRMRFVITRGENGLIVGQSVNTWEHDSINYTLKSVTETTGLAAIFKPARVVQESHGEVTSAGLRPLEFRNERKGGTDAAQFDWTSHVVSYAGRADPLTEGTQDMLSMYYQLVLLVAQANPASAPELPLELSIATGRKLERYRFELVGEESLIYQGTAYRTLHLQTQSGGDIIELWVAHGMPGMPLKIRFTDRKGEIFDQLAEDISSGSPHEPR